jgi:hypothetical protein
MWLLPNNDYTQTASLTLICNFGCNEQRLFAPTTLDIARGW